VGREPEPRGLFSPGLAPITTATLMAVAVVAFDGLAVSAALPAMTEDLGDVGMVAGVFTGFLVASSIAVIASGPLVDHLGVRPTFRVGAALFALASLACGLAPSMPALVVFRIAQGAAGGMVITSAISTVGLAYPRRLQSRGFAANSTVWGTMSLVAPGVTALLLELMSWRGVFLLSAPLALAAMAVGWRRLPTRLEGAATGMRLDWWGLLLVAGFVIVLTVGASSIGPLTGVAALGAAGLAALYWRHAGRRPDPVVERSWLAEMPWVGINVAPAAAMGAALGAEAFLTLFVAGSLDGGNLVIAASVVPLSLGWTLAALTASKLLEHVSETAVAVAAFAVLIPSLAVAALTFTDDVPVGLVWLVTFGQGVGVGLVTNSMLTLLQSRAPAARIGRASSAHTFLRSTSHTLAIAISSAVLLFVVGRRTGDVEEVRRLLEGDDATVSSSTAAALAAGYRWAHVAALGLAVVGLVAALSVRISLAGERRRAGRGRPAEAPA
jgi:MFS family permease